jgi:hypothetical protein
MHRSYVKSGARQRAGIARRQRAARRSDARKWGSDPSPAELERDRAEKRAERRKVSNERAPAALEEVLGLFESGDLPSMVARTVIARQESDSPIAYWSLGNQLLALLAGTSDARGYRQWQEAGRHVVKGSRAFHILGPSTRKVEDEESGEAKTIVLGFHPIPVFRYEDTEGFPLQTPDYDPPAPPPLADVASRWGIPVTYAPNVGQSWLGLYRHSFGAGAREAVEDDWTEGAVRVTESIMLASHDEQVFFHELAHAAHQRALAKDGKDLSGEPTKRKELVAELTAAVLGRLHGLTLGDLAWSREYLKHHAGAKSLGSACMGVLSEVQACLREILESDEAVAVAVDGVAA